MTQPTEVQIEEFWEWCGFKQLGVGRGGYHFRRTKKVWNWLHPNETERHKSIPFLPQIDLNNLFKYAVPKVYDMKLVKANRFEQEWKVAYSARVRMAGGYWTETPKCEDPALVLFWAIYKLIGVGKE